MACHPEPQPLTEARVIQLIREHTASAIAASVRHCPACGTSPISRIVACTEADCPARVPAQLEEAA